MATSNSTISIDTWKDDHGYRMMTFAVRDNFHSSHFSLTAPCGAPVWQEPSTHLAIIEALFFARRIDIKRTGQVEV